MPRYRSLLIVVSRRWHAPLGVVPDGTQQSFLAYSLASLSGGYDADIEHQELRISHTFIPDRGGMTLGWLDRPSRSNCGYKHRMLFRRWEGLHKIAMHLFLNCFSSWQ